MQRKILIILFFCCLPAGSVFSQNWLTYYYFGVGRSAIDYTYSVGYFLGHADKTRYDIGIGFEIPPRKSLLSLRGDIIYQNKGSSNIRLNLNYITLPLVPKINIGKKFTFYAGVGFYFSFMFYSDNFYDVYNNPNKFDFGITYNIGFRKIIKELYGVFLEWSTYNGLIPVYRLERSSPGGSKSMNNYKNYSYYINLGFIYKINSPQK